MKKCASIKSVSLEKVTLLLTVLLFPLCANIVPLCDLQRRHGMLCMLRLPVVKMAYFPHTQPPYVPLGSPTRQWPTCR